VVKLAQVRRCHYDVTHRRGLLVTIQRHRRRGLGGPAAHAQQDGLHVVTRWATARLDDALHLVQAVLVEQGQDTHVVLDATSRAVLFLQGFAEVAEERRQLPTPKDVGVIQRRRPALQGTQVMVRIEDLLVLAVRTRMRGDHLATQQYLDAVDVGFDADGLERRRTRHAVAIVVEAHHLILVGLGGLHEAGIEPACA
jgi:hypothetical protein